MKIYEELKRRGLIAQVTNEEEIGDLLLGPECCLWTETVPEHRVIPKLLPRLCAFAETAWTPSRRRTWFNYTCRRETLTACGWFDLKV